MALMIAGRHIPHSGILSEPGRLALGFVDGGLQWLDWAANSAAATYDFPDETAFVANVQQGLHASPLTLLPRLELLASPVKLMTLAAADLRALHKAEAGDDSAVIGVQVKKILADHTLLTRADLAAAAAFLAQMEVAAAPLFQNLALDDQLALYELLRLMEGQNAQNPELAREAAAFAVKQARTPVEFVDYFKCFLHLTAKLEALQGSAAQRIQLAEQALHTLLPLLFGSLDCPEVAGGLVSPGEVAQAVSAWLARGRRIGFSRLSDGVQQIVQHTPFRNETGEAARAAIDRYLAAAQSFLASVKPERGRMRQDGASCVFPLKLGEQAAELQLDGNGAITLLRFSGQPARPTKAQAAAGLKPRNPKERARWQRPGSRKQRSR